MVKLYGEEGLALQQKYLGKFIGYFTTETGNLNQVVFMWGFESLDDRVRSRLAGGLVVEMGSLGEELRFEILRTRIQFQRHVAALSVFNGGVRRAALLKSACRPFGRDLARPVRRPSPRPPRHDRERFSRAMHRRDL